MGRGVRRLAPAVAAALALAAIVAAGAVARGAPSVLVATTGSKSELLKTVPITKNAGAEPRVVMSMRPSGVPSLATADRLEATAEVLVNTDCLHRSSGRCSGRPYGFDPRVAAELLLADAENVTNAGGHAVRLGRRSSICLAGLPNREHHCVTVFSNESLDVNALALPCPEAECRLNLVLSAHHRKARGGEVLTVGRDKGRINALRFNPGSQPAVAPLETGRRVTTRLIPRLKRKVVYSQKLPALEEDEQIEAKATLRTGIGHLSYNTLISSVLVLSNDRHGTAPSAFVERVASHNGELSERNGFNCTQNRTPCTNRKVGVLTMHDDAIRDGNPVPLFANLVVTTNAKRAESRARDRVKVLEGGGLQVTRFPASLRG